MLCKFYMNNKTPIQALDTLIEKSELALNFIEQQEWELFIDMQQQRQTLFESLNTQDMPSTIEVIERFKIITSINETLLEQSQTYQQQLKEALSKLRKGKTANKAYQQ